MDFNAKWFIIGIGTGLAISIILGGVLLAMYPPESIEQLCFDSTLTQEDYEKCVTDLKLN